MAQMIHPCKAPISQRFGDEFAGTVPNPQGVPTYYSKVYAHRFNLPDGHPGYDYAPPWPFDPWKVYAAADGVIEFAGWGSGWDSTVAGGSYTLVIRHPHLNVWTAYLHLTANSEKYRVGQKVKQGDFVALTGNTGVGTGPHLHFQVMPIRPRPLVQYRNWGTIDPTPFFKETVKPAAVVKNDWFDTVDEKTLIKIIDERLDKAIYRHLTYHNTTRTKRDLYALTVDGGLNATTARDNTVKIIKQNEALTKLIVGMVEDLDPAAILDAINRIKVTVVASADNE